MGTHQLQPAVFHLATPERSDLGRLDPVASHSPWTQRPSSARGTPSPLTPNARSGSSSSLAQCDPVRQRYSSADQSKLPCRATSDWALAQNDTVQTRIDRITELIGRVQDNVDQQQRLLQNTIPETIQARGCIAFHCDSPTTLSSVSTPRRFADNGDEIRHI